MCKIITCCVLFYRQKLPLEVGSHIVMKGDRTGYVRYLGHLDGVGQHKVVFAGIQLDAPGDNTNIIVSPVHTSDLYM